MYFVITKRRAYFYSPWDIVKINTRKKVGGEGISYMLYSEILS